MKAKNVRLYYGIFLSVFTGVVAVLFIVQAVLILADGNWTNGAYTLEIVSERLFPISIPFYIWIAAIAAGFILSLVFPYEEKVVNKISPRATQKRLLSRMPQVGKDEFKGVLSDRRRRIILYSVCGTVSLICAIASLVYVCDASNFDGFDANGSMLKMLINVGPWLLVGFASGITLCYVETYILNSENSKIKALIAENRGKPSVDMNLTEPAFITKIKGVLTSKWFKWALRGTVLAFGVVFVILGIFNGGMQAVLGKAITICKQCIGLG